MTNRRAQKIGILNKLPPSYPVGLDSPPRYPIRPNPLPPNIAPKYNFVVRGWDDKTDQTHASVRMFLAKPMPGFITPIVEFLAIPGQTIIASGQSFSEGFELTRAKPWDSPKRIPFPSLKQKGFKFCVQVVLDEESLAALPTQPLFKHLSRDLPHLDRDVYSERSQASLPKLPNSHLLCKTATF